MPGVGPEVVQSDNPGMIVGKHHIDPTGKKLPSLVMKSSRRTGSGMIIVPIDQTFSDVMSAAGSIAVRAVVQIC